MARQENKIHFRQSASLVGALYDLAASGASEAAQRIVAICLEHEFVDVRDKEEAKAWRRLAVNTATGKKAQEFVDAFEGIIPQSECGTRLRPLVLNVRRMPGMPSAGFKAGLAFFNRRDYERAIHWLTRGLALGGVEAAFYLGVCHLFGLGTAQSFRKAIEYFPEEVRQELSFLSQFIYEEELQGVFEKQDRLDKLIRSAGEGCEESQMLLAAAYESGSLGRKDEKEAFRWYREAAGKENVEALLKLGEWHAREENGGWMAGEAFRFFKRAADMGSNRAQLWLGDYYMKKSDAPDKVNALKWYRKAAVRNEHRAQYRLARLCEGSPDKKIQAEAAYWYYRALPFLPEARQALQDMFPACRLEPLLLSATWGDALAQLDMGICCACGIGGAVNKAEAGKWFKAAAGAGSALAADALKEWENLSGKMPATSSHPLLSVKKSKKTIVHYDPNEVDEEDE